MDINTKLVRLRAEMKAAKIDAVIIPSSDPHQSEYVAAHWSSREWISGFTGSAGTVVITSDYAGLWTDSRYFIQAEEELSSSDFVLHKVANYNPDFIPFLLNRLKDGSIVACDGNIFSHSEILSIERTFADKNIKMVCEQDLIGKIWLDRPAIPENKVMIHPDEYAGKTVAEKLGQIRNGIDQANCDHYLLTALDDIAWTFNLRGNDIECNPVFIAYAVISMDKAILFLEASKLTDKVKQKLSSDKIEVLPYGEVAGFLKNINSSDQIYLTAAGVNYTLYNSIECKIVDGKDLVAAYKTIKNPVEIKHYHNAMEKDAVALTKLYRWLDTELDQREVSEFEVSEKLAGFRSQQEDYFGESFHAIVGYAANGAIVHYRPEETGSAMIRKKGILLLDSGGQYMDGTTDITRTSALGEPSAEQKRNFTLVLKGNIAVDSLEFPAGTNGYQLDTFARQFMWKDGLNYMHGTGHGVGFFLNVHEGPQGISFVLSERSKTPLEPGMVTSNEPGYYKQGEYGIRIENLIVTKEVRETEFGRFLGHETLTLFPIDQQLIDRDLMENSELKWINEYHQMVYDRVAPRLDEEEGKWLKEKCKPIL